MVICFCAPLHQTMIALFPSWAERVCWSSSLSLNGRIILNCQFAPSEVLSLILDIESLMGTMGNKHISFKSLQCLDSQDPQDSNLGAFDQ